MSMSTPSRKNSFQMPMQVCSYFLVFRPSPCMSSMAQRLSQSKSMAALVFTSVPAAGAICRSSSPTSATSRNILVSSVPM